VIAADVRDRLREWAHTWHDLDAAKLVDQLLDQYDMLQWRAQEWALALQSLTPGGSEYVDDPERCVAFVRETRKSQHAAILAATKRAKEAAQPIPMILYCPSCELQHVDVDDDTGAWATTRHHRKHLCANCGHVWQPALVHTVGVVDLNTEQSPEREPEFTDHRAALQDALIAFQRALNEHCDNPIPAEAFAIKAHAVAIRDVKTDIFGPGKQPYRFGGD
jgi:rubredoxin